MQSIFLGRGILSAAVVIGMLPTTILAQTSRVEDPNQLNDQQFIAMAKSETNTLTGGLSGTAKKSFRKLRLVKSIDGKRRLCGEIKDDEADMWASFSNDLLPTGATVEPHPTLDPSLQQFSEMCRTAIINMQPGKPAPPEAIRNCSVVTLVAEAGFENAKFKILWKIQCAGEAIVLPD